MPRMQDASGAVPIASSDGYGADAADTPPRSDPRQHHDRRPLAHVKPDDGPAGQLCRGRRVIKAIVLKPRIKCRLRHSRQ
jgi:hypothetical protein